MGHNTHKNQVLLLLLFFFINRLFTMMKVWYIVVNIDGLIKQNPNPSMGQWMSSEGSRVKQCNILNSYPPILDKLKIMSKCLELS